MSQQGRKCQRGKAGMEDGEEKGEALMLYEPEPGHGGGRCHGGLLKEKDHIAHDHQTLRGKYAPGASPKLSHESVQKAEELEEAGEQLREFRGRAVTSHACLAVRVCWGRAWLCPFKAELGATRSGCFCACEGRNTGARRGDAHGAKLSLVGGGSHRDKKRSNAGRKEPITGHRSRSGFQGCVDRKRGRRSGIITELRQLGSSGISQQRRSSTTCGYKERNSSRVGVGRITEVGSRTNFLRHSPHTSARQAVEQESCYVSAGTKAGDHLRNFPSPHFLSRLWFSATDDDDDEDDTTLEVRCMNLQHALTPWKSFSSFTSPITSFDYFYPSRSHW
ncbi:unnamed protein product [Pleuronectes platessa]|uniref:Uncharacterized protein n=1 Tax=Pleuronectes platessa TaxID=8262 RepID=A0A9N7TLA0_PLEPL|nr:unnamed protein product [Pleuronectes platessa]